MTWLYAFFDMLDFSEVVERALDSVRSVRGIPALVMACLLTWVNYALLPWIWHFDLESTAAWVSQALTLLENDPADILGFLMEQDEWVAVSQQYYTTGLAFTGMLLVPTIIVMLGARFARFRVHLASVLVFAMASIDLVTDWPRVRDACALLLPTFEQIPLIGWPLFWLFRLLCLFAASFGIEMWFAVTAVCIVFLIFSGLAVGSGGRQTPRRGGF
jgi:MFS family permease